VVARGSRSPLVRVHSWATSVWLTLICAGGLGFVARDVLEAGRPVVVLAWIAGAVLGAGPVGGRPRTGPSNTRPRDRWRSELGQASVEWAALVLTASLALAALAAFGPSIDGRSFGGFLAHRLACAVRGGCDDGERGLARAYGSRGAALVREHAPNLAYESGERQLPVDWRVCRHADCAGAPDDPELDAHRTDSGGRATVFTRVLRRDGRTYIQYWLYYPESNTAFAGADKAWEASWLLPKIKEVVTGSGDWPGFHRDDWESYHVRLDPDGSAWARASSHGHYQGCKSGDCHNRWAARTGWTRVSRGSHAGHIPLREQRGQLRPVYPGPDLPERSTTSEGLRLIPLETLDRRRYRRLDKGIEPPWRKDAYHDPTSDES
jgi:hypothetical protein